MPLGLPERYDHLKKLCDLVSTSESLRLARPTGHSRLRCKEHSTWTTPVDGTVVGSRGGGTRDKQNRSDACPVFAGASGGLISPSTDCVILLKLSSALILGQQVLDDVDRNAGGAVCVGGGAYSGVCFIPPTSH